MCALQKICPEFLQEGRLCWLRSPLYVVKTNKKNYYYYSDEEYAKNNIKGDISRMKGLGALSAEQANESMFTNEFQRLDKLTFNEDCSILLNELMGIDVEPRREFIFENVDFTKITE